MRLWRPIDPGELPAVEGVEADGLVGEEGFRRFGVTIDNAGKTLMEVADVGTDSAGVRAGPHADDVLSAIDGQPVKERGLPQWRQRRRELPAGTTLRIPHQR